MNRQNVFPTIKTAALLLAGVTVVSQAKAEEPSFRYCEAGLNYERFSAEVQDNSSGGTTIVSGTYNDGLGYQFDCKIRVFDRLFLSGGYSQAAPDSSLSYTSTLSGAGVTFPIEDSDVTRWRAAIGYFHTLVPGLALYGQAGLGRMRFEPGGEVISSCPSPECGASFPPPAAKSTAFDGEVGARWTVASWVEIGVFGRYDGAGGVRATLPRERTVYVEAEGEFRGGGTVAVKVAGPVWLSARYETGNTDRAFVGGRVAF